MGGKNAQTKYFLSSSRIASMFRILRVITNICLSLIKIIKFGAYLWKVSHCLKNTFLFLNKKVIKLKRELK